MKTFVSSFSLFGALTSLLIQGCAASSPSDPDVPHYRFDAQLQCSSCSDRVLGQPGDTIKVLLLRDGGVPGEDIIVFDQSYDFERRETLRQIEFQFPNHHVGSSPDVWVEVSVAQPDGSIRAQGRQRVMQRQALPEINRFELELQPDAAPEAPDLLDQLPPL